MNFRHLIFEKENSRWYIFLPNWGGPKSDLEMVCGADTLLDILSKGEDSVLVTLYEPVEHSVWVPENHLKLVGITPGGADYIAHFQGMEPMPVWLCDVTQYVLGEFPETIYIIGWRTKRELRAILDDTRRSHTQGPESSEV